MTTMPKKPTSESIEKSERDALVFGGILLVVGIAAVLIFKTQIRSAIDGLVANVKNSTNASIQVASIDTNPGTRIRSGEPDDGIELTCVVSNQSDTSRDITITATLSSSEGEWEREQTLRFNANESKELEYFFHEPTIDATNLQSRVKIK